MTRNRQNIQCRGKRHDHKVNLPLRRYLRYLIQYTPPRHYPSTLSHPPHSLRRTYMTDSLAHAYLTYIKSHHLQHILPQRLGRAQPPPPKANHQATLATIPPATCAPHPQQPGSPPPAAGVKRAKKPERHRRGPKQLLLDRRDSATVSGRGVAGRRCRRMLRS